MKSIAFVSYCVLFVHNSVVKSTPQSPLMYYERSQGKNENIFCTYCSLASDGIATNHITIPSLVHLLPEKVFGNLARGTLCHIIQTLLPQQSNLLLLGAKQIYNSFHHSYFIPFGFIGSLPLAYHPFHSCC